jgi:adenylate kinase
MMWGITGVPGTGKSSIADELERRGHRVVRLTDTVDAYVTGTDPDRDTRIVDVERWAVAFSPVEGIVEGHLAHLLACDRVVVLRCRPDVLRERLAGRRYRQAKIEENAEAEALDVILIETLELHPAAHIFELDTTALTAGEAADRIEAFMHGKQPPEHGIVDWSASFL